VYTEGMANEMGPKRKSVIRGYERIRLWGVAQAVLGGVLALTGLAIEQNHGRALFMLIGGLGLVGNGLVQYVKSENAIYHYTPRPKFDGDED
jgi:hypothetical protein